MSEVGIRITNLDEATTAGANSQIVFVNEENTTTLRITKENFLSDAGFIQLEDLSIAQETASGTGSLAYEQTTGVFTYTPPQIPTDLAQLADATDLLAVDATDVTNLNTTNVTEGDNQYFTALRARAAMQGSNSITVNASTGVISTVQSIRTTDDVEFANITASNFITADGGFYGNLTGTVSTISNHDTSDLQEDPNATTTSGTMYFTNQRARDAVLTGLSTTDVSEGTRLYHTTARVDAIFATKNIGELADVDTSTNEPLQNQTLRWDVSAGKWVPGLPDTTPVGIVNWFATSSAPGGWLECDGSGVSDVYPDLRNLLLDAGSPYGTDESTNPRLPDLRGVTVRGWDNERGVDSNRIFGSYQADGFKSHTHNSGTLTTSSAGAHTHSVPLESTDEFGYDNQARFSRSRSSLATFPVTTGSAGNHTHSITGNTGGQGGNETRMKNVALLPCIKAYGVVNIAGVAEIENIFETVASEAEAIAGILNDKVITPLTLRAAIDDAIADITPDPVYAGVTTLANVQSTFSNNTTYPVGTKVSFIEERTYYRPANSNGGSVKIDDRTRRVVKKTSPGNWQYI